MSIYNISKEDREKVIDFVFNSITKNHQSYYLVQELDNKIKNSRNEEREELEMIRRHIVSNFALNNDCLRTIIK